MHRLSTSRIMRKLLILPFVLPVIAIDFNGCWRPVTAALDEVGIGVHTYGDDLSFSFWDDHHEDDD